MAQRRRAHHRAHHRSDAAVATAVALALAACGGGGTQKQYGVPEDPIPEAEPAKPKPPPKRGFTWTVALPSSKRSDATDVAADAAGHVYVAGKFTGVMTLGAQQLQSRGGADVFVAQLSAEDGTLGWAAHLSGEGRDDNALIAVDPTGDVIVSASVGGKVVVTKYAGADGAEQWSTEFASEAPIGARGLAVDAGGNVVVGGTFRAAASVNDTKLIHVGGRDAFVARLSGEDGSTTWSATIGNRGDNDVCCVAVDGDGNLYVAGSFGGTLDVGGASLTARKRQLQLFLASFDDGGALRWAKRLDVSRTTVGWDLAVDGGGNAALVGVFREETTLQTSSLTSRGDVDGFVASYDPAGEPRWFVHHGAEHADTLRTADFTLADQAVVAGTVGEAVHVASYSPTGELEWTHRADATGGISSLAASVDPFGFVYVVGGFSKQLTAGDTTLDAEGVDSAFVTKLRP